jgi:hypothetical protein
MSVESQAGVARFASASGQCENPRVYRRCRGDGQSLAQRWTCDELVGRLSECESLDLLIAAVRAGESRVLVVRVEPGVGKTALLGHVVEQSADCLIARGRCPVRNGACVRGVASVARPDARSRRAAPGSPARCAMDSVRSQPRSGGGSRKVFIKSSASARATSLTAPCRATQQRAAPVTARESGVGGCQSTAANCTGHWRMRPRRTHGDTRRMNTWLNGCIEPRFRTIDGLSIRYAESEERDEHALLLSPWPELVV